MKSRKSEEEERGGPPEKCSGCKKVVLNGQGIQVEEGDRLLRFCAKCYQKTCEKES